MRILIYVKFPVEPFNTYVKHGSAGARIQKIMAEAKPEAAYFGGQRGGMIVVNLDDASKIPALAEPWFPGFNAHVEFHPAMTPRIWARQTWALSERSGPSAYFTKAGSVVNVCAARKRNASALICPPLGVSNSMVPRMLAAAGYLSVTSVKAKWPLAAKASVSVAI